MKKPITIKKVVAVVIFLTFALSAISHIFYKFILEPCAEMYNKYGIIGIFAFLFAAVIFCIAIYFVIKVLNWAIDNL